LKSLAMSTEGQRMVTCEASSFAGLRDGVWETTATRTPTFALRSWRSTSHRVLFAFSHEGFPRGCKLRRWDRTALGCEERSGGVRKYVGHEQGVLCGFSPDGPELLASGEDAKEGKEKEGNTWEPAGE